MIAYVSLYVIKNIPTSNYWYFIRIKPKNYYFNYYDYDYDTITNSKILTL